VGSTGAEGADFDEVFTAEFPRLVGIAGLIVGDRGRAREIVQESFARALARWDRVGRYDSPQAWLTTVTVRQAVRARDRSRREPPVGDHALGGGPTPGPASAVEARLLVQQALRELPPQQRAVVVLHHLEDRPIAEVAELLGVRQGTVKTQLSRARARIAALLEADVIAEVHP